MRERSCCGSFFHALGTEFQRDKFGLAHEPVGDFCKSQWQKGTRSLLWVVYRWCLAGCFAGGVIGSLVQQFNEGKWFIYLTDWGFFLCMFASVYGAVLVTMYHVNPEEFYPRAFVLKFYWLSHWSTLVLATVITFIYWLFIYPGDEASPTALYNLWAHAFNSILMVLDHMLVAFPTRILHLVYPLTLGVVYGVFSVIYYFAGGVDPIGNRYIYEILDWSEPGLAMGTITGCILLLSFFGLFLYGLYKLREWIYRKCNSNVMVLSTA